MIATDFKLIPLANLVKHEAEVVRRLDALPFSYQKNLLDEPEVRYAFLYYALLTHWPELVGDDYSAEELLYNRLYWFLRLAELYQPNHDFEADFQERGADLLEAATIELGPETVSALQRRAHAEFAKNKWEMAVSFSSFSLKKVKEVLGLQVDENSDFFAQVAPLKVSSLLLETFHRSVPLALKINTEKARSELIVAPLLMEVYRQLDGKISLFSGVDWEVDAAQGLRGRCDFLLGLTSEQFMIEAPVLAIVEVKNEDIAAGIAQCLAEMVAAQIFNRRKGREISPVCGVVTAGNTWRFLRLIGSTAFVDVSEYHIKEVERIVGIIVSMFTSNGVPLKA